MPRTQKPRGPTKAELFSEIAEATGLTRVQVDAVFTALTERIKVHLGHAPHEVSVAGLMKIVRFNKPARPERMGRNPAPGAQMMFKAKAASKGIRVRPMKPLKDMV